MPKQGTQLGPEYRNTSVSWGTMRPNDLFEAFREFLPEEMQAEYLALPDPDSDDVTVGSAEYRARDEFLGATIWDYMMAIAPEGCSFGSTDGDGANYGFWSDDDDEPADDDEDEPELRQYDVAIRISGFCYGVVSVQASSREEARQQAA